MALQGTLDTFALDDVLRLLAATRKTGRLDLRGDHDSGSVWVATGEVVGAAAERCAPSAQPAEAVFELLRCAAGTFTFDVDAAAPRAVEPQGVDVVLDAAGAMLAEWREIEAVVPSLTSNVQLRSDLPSDQVSIDRAQWSTLLAVGSGSSVGTVGDHLGLGELPACRAVKELVDAGLADVSTPPPVPEAAEVEVAEPDAGTVAPEPEPLGEAGLDQPAEADSPPGAEAWVEPEAMPVASDEGDDDADADADGPDVEDPDGIDEAAHLSPRAAEAVRASASTDDDDDESSRGMLLKFLSSVKS